MDFSALTDTQLDSLITKTRTHMERLLDGAQGGSVGAGRNFYMARLGELTTLLTRLSEEKRLRSADGGDFILTEFGEPQ